MSMIFAGAAASCQKFLIVHVYVFAAVAVTGAVVIAAAEALWGHQGSTREAPGRHQGCTKDAPIRHN